MARHDRASKGQTPEAQDDSEEQTARPTSPERTGVRRGVRREAPSPGCTSVPRRGRSESSCGWRARKSEIILLEELKPGQRIIISSGRPTVDAG